MSNLITPDSAISKLAVDPYLLNAAIEGTRDGLEMAGICPAAVGATCFFAPRNPMSVIVGLVGRSSGTITLNLTEGGMLHIVSQLMGEEVTSVSEESIDGIMEIGNMVAGRVKVALADSEYEIDNISLPSVIFGHGYQVLYSTGITTVGVEFELTGIPFSLDNDRFFSSTISLLSGPGAGA